MLSIMVRLKLKPLLLAVTCLHLTACGGTSDVGPALSPGVSSSSVSSVDVSSSVISSNSSSVMSSSSAAFSSSVNNVSANGGRDLVIKAGSLAGLDSSGSVIPEGAAGRFTWAQTGGPNVIAQRGQDSSMFEIIAPVMADAQTLLFTLDVTANGSTSQDDIEVDVLPCDDPQGSIFGECLSYPFGPFLAYEALADGTKQTKYFGDAGHVQWVSKTENNRGLVIEASWNKSDRKNTRADNGWFGVNVQTAGNDLSAYKDGAISFDLKMLNNTDVSVPLFVRLDCGPTCRSDDFVIRPSRLGNDWRTFTMPLVMFSASGMDLSKTLRFLIWPQWGKQEHYVQLQLDNIRLSQTYKAPTPKDSCPGTGEVSFNFVRKENPTAAEQEAYGRIQNAMEEATALYNCYTSLKRVVTVYYNPDVPTANASHQSGVMNFGGSISTRTALHEYGHIFGVGFGNFKSWLVDGKFTGPRVSALIKKIDNNPAAVINGGGTHIWPYGLNFPKEDSEQARINHCLIVEALAADIKKLGPTQ